MAPLGIITAFVSAIRVGGPNWLKALVGRARENIAAAEVEVMSSTSHDVCELWNGTAIVRTVGRPMVKQLIYIDWLKDEKDGFGLFTLDKPAGQLVMKDPRGPSTLLGLEIARFVHRVKAFAMSKLGRPERGGDGRSSIDKEERGISSKSGGSPVAKELQPSKLQRVDQSRMDESPAEEAPNVPQADESPTEEAPNVPQMDKPPAEEAPNISLNLHGETVILELASYALFGVVLQVGVLVFAGFATYHPYLKTKLGGQRATVGFPLQAAGTILLVAGMALCSLAVEQSTEEKRWIASSSATKANSSSSKDRPRMLWLQKRNFVGDQGFDSFLLVAKRECDEILTSRRPAKDGGQSVREGAHKGIHNNRLGVLTVLGVAFGMLGFIAQFEGFRLSNWSNTIAQLVAVFLMTILRAVVRRGLTTRPVVEKLPEAYEMDWLALKIANDPNFLKSFDDSNSQDQSIPTWNITTPNLGNNIALRSKQSRTQPLGKGQEAMKIRQRLGELTGWAGPASEEAISVANAIEMVMNKLFSSEPQTTLIWSLKVGFDGSKDQSGEQIEFSRIEFTVTKSDSQSKYPWKADATEIEAALSLWGYHFWKQYDDSKTLSLQPESGSCDWLRPTESRLARPCRRVLGRDTDALHRDLAWWVGDGIAQESRAKYEDQNTSDILWWGFDGLESESEPSGKSSRTYFAL
ncbi:hypothetical protein GP486_006781 [Trichoglossum hirsutum]|uniref:Uncharacterized protein n=1 Tax=Trichoglossum hirsutum TaxID=265104 RepID=A0A9P8L794_9PEZI|nr:hypothetical protein GP486_006781 [Trichoglossum hirsutum]